MGVILGIAVLLDATVIRLVLMPTLLRVFGHRAWALPGWLDRILPDMRAVPTIRDCISSVVGEPRQCGREACELAPAASGGRVMSGPV
jgi:hypothetical protein